MSTGFDRRAFLKASAAGAALASCSRWSVEPSFDLVIRGGTIVDGSGGRTYAADLGLRGDVIAAIGALPRSAGREALDATGLCVAPGFVDIHSHSDRELLNVPSADSRVLQGYTCEITGNCGGSAAPRKADVAKSKPALSVEQYFADVERARPAIHHALLVGHGTLRENAIGEIDRRTTPEELAAMTRELEQALDEGAVGLSSGLEYVPGIYTPPEELQALAKTVARRGRLYASHMRNEDVRLFEAVDEALELARATGARTQVSHLKCAGRGNWWKQAGALERIEKARAGGLDVLADAYPYTAYSTTLTVLFPSWAREGGNAELAKRLADPALRAKLRIEVAERVAEEPGGYELIQIASKLAGANAPFSGKTIADLAAAKACEAIDALLDLVLAEHGTASYIGHAMSVENVAKVLAHPLVMVGSDGYVQARTPPAGESSNPHPRSFGTAARVLGEYCRDRKALDLASAVKKLAAMPAERAQLARRGRIERGFHADLVLFDFARVQDETTFTDPRRPPTGIEFVLVDGEVVVRRGALTEARPGKVLRA
ncbi:MAG: D-aminoacylase [Planctomycetes bacterium]|nr:D-aminoacylase [Planctomycetota bacterium]